MSRREALGQGNSHSRCAPQLRRGRTRLVAPGANADSGTRHKDRRTEREPGRRTKKDSGCGYDVKTRRLLKGAWTSSVIHRGRWDFGTDHPEHSFGLSVCLPSGKGPYHPSDTMSNSSPRLPSAAHQPWYRQGFHTKLITVAKPFPGKTILRTSRFVCLNRFGRFVCGLKGGGIFRENGRVNVVSAL